MHLQISAAVLALALTHVLQLTGMLQWWTRQTVEVENNMTSVERMVEYIKLPQEPPRYVLYIPLFLGREGEYGTNMSLPWDEYVQPSGAGGARFDTVYKVLWWHVAAAVAKCRAACICLCAGFVFVCQNWA